jgi:hypothetical protein
MYTSSFRNKRRFIGGADDNGGASASENQRADYLYYNAVINGAATNRFSLAPAQAFYSEVRSIPLLPDTTGWNMAVSRLATVGATDNFPLLIPQYSNPATYESIYSIGTSVRIAGETTITPGTVTADHEFTLTNNPYNGLGFWGDSTNPISYLGVNGVTQLNFFLGRANDVFATVNDDEDNAVRVSLQCMPLGWMNSLRDIQTMIDNACATWNAVPRNASWRVNMTIDPIINASGASDSFRFLITSPPDNTNYLPNRPDWNPARIISPQSMEWTQYVQNFLAVRSGPTVDTTLAGSWAGIGALHFRGSGTTFESAVFTNTAGPYGGLHPVQYASLPGMVGNQTQINQWRYTQIGTPFPVPANLQANSVATFQWSFKFSGFGSFVPSAFEFVVIYLDPGITDIAAGRVISSRVVDVETAVAAGPYPTSYASITTGPFANPYVSATAFNLNPSGGTFVAAVRRAGTLLPPDVPSSYFIQGPFGVNITNFTYTSVSGIINTVFSAQRPIIFNPQNTGHPTWITSYDYFANQINNTLKTIADDISSQLIAAYGLLNGFTYGLRNNSPTLSYDSNSGLFSLNTWPDQYAGVVGTPNYVDATTSSSYGSVFRFSNGSFVPIPAPTSNAGPLNIALYDERWSISMNTALAQLIPFPVTNNKDNDSNSIDASAMQISWTGATQSTDANGVLKLQLAQEYVSTAAWNPFVGLAISTNSIPAQFETSGQTIVSSGQVPVPQVGNTTNPILFDLDFSTTNAHSLLQGISFSPTIHRWVQLSGGPLADIGFYVYLKTRDNTLVPWDVPAFGMIDIKFLFSHSTPGILA